MTNKIIFLIILTSLFSACAHHKKDDPLIVPPAYSELPDLKNPEKSDQKNQDPDLEDLKKLLIEN